MACDWTYHSRLHTAEAWACYLSGSAIAKAATSRPLLGSENVKVPRQDPAPTKSATLRLVK